MKDIVKIFWACVGVGLLYLLYFVIVPHCLSADNLLLILIGAFLGVLPVVASVYFVIKGMKENA